MSSTAVVTTRPGLFMHIDTTPPIRIWSGPYQYRMPADGLVEIEGGIYEPLALSAFPTLDRLLDGGAGEYVFTVDGGSPELIAKLDVPEDFSGARVTIGQLKFDAAWRPLDEVEWVGDFDAEHIGQSVVQHGDGHSASIAMTVGTASTDRRLAIQMHWSDTEQRMISPTDAFFSFVLNYPAGAKRQYPA